MGGIEVTAARAGGSIATFLGKRLWRRMRLKALREWSTPTIPAAVARATIDELTDDEAVALSSYLDSPDFEQLALQLVLLDTWTDDVRPTVREELRHGLRHATGLPGDRLVGLTDLVFDALLIASRVDDLRLDPIDVAVRGYLAAAAARNGELLSRVKSLKTFHEKVVQLCAQVRAIHGELRLPHTRTSRTVPWDRLYVEPHVKREPGIRNVILGDPGAGKSTFATKLAYDTAGTGIAPFLVVLRDMPVSALERRFVEHLVTVAAAPYNVDMSTEAVEYLLLNGRAMVICDGLDELIDVGMRRRIVDLIDGFASLYPMARIVVTSRSVGYGQVPLKPALFHIATIEPFDSDQVAAYAANWFALDEGHGPRIHRAFIAESETILDLRSNPLLLSLLCGMYSSEQYIPRNRTEVYEKCAVMLFDRWDSMRGIKMPLGFQGFVRGAIQRLAWHMFAVSERPELPKRKVMSVLMEYLRAKGFDEDDARQEAGDFLDFCAGRAWVLAEVGSTEWEPIYGFAHRTFMEFFAAEHIVRHHATAPQVFELLGDRIRDPGWEEVAHLAIQLFDRNHEGGAEQVLDLILERQSVGTEIAFAARAAGHVPFSPALSARVVAAAIRSAKKSTAEDRVRLGFHRGELGMLSFWDAPLHSLRHESLDSNRRYLERAIDEQLRALAAQGDEVAALLCRPEPDASWSDPRSLYVGTFSCGKLWHPVVFRLTPDKAKEVGAWLMRQPTPWLRGEPIPDVWYQALSRFPWEHMVLMLPYLEWMAQNPQPWDAPAAGLIRGRRTGRMDNALKLPEDSREFVQRWICREFSVLG